MMRACDYEEIFTAIFSSVDELKRALLVKGEQAGLFVPSTRQIAVGSRVVLRLGIKGHSQRVPLQTTVVWRRVRAGGPRLPEGVFVALDRKDQDRIDGIVKFFSLAETVRERRKYERLPVLVSARYRTAKGEYESSTRDLSRGGAFLHCQGPLLQVGARFPLRLFLQEIEGKEIELEAEVAWVEVMQPSKGMGVAFVSRAASLRQLSRTLKRLEKNFIAGE